MTKRAMGNLLNRYRSVLKKCHIMNTFGSLAVASILVMGAASGEAFSNTTGYNAADPASSGTTISATDQSENAVASAIKVDTAATYTVPDTVTRAEATAIGKQSARALGVFVQGSAGNRLTLDSLDISSKAITENGKSISYGIFSDKSSSVSVNEGTITASSQSKNGLGECVGAVSNNNSSAVLGVNSIISSSESHQHTAEPKTVGAQASGRSTLSMTSDKVTVKVSATHNGNVFSRKVNGIYGEGNSTLTMNDADISVHERNNTPEKSGAAGIHLFTASTLTMKNGTIRVTTIDPEGTFAGSAVGIVTSATSGRHGITAGTLDIRAQGGWSSGIQLENTDMRMAGGTILSEAVDRPAYGIRATQTNFTATGDVSLEVLSAKAGSAIGGILSIGDSSVTMRGGSVTAVSKGNGAIGLYAKGGSITKTGGDITVVSAGTSSGMDAFPASRITYGDAGATTRVSVEGKKAYGLRAGGEAGTGQASSIELTNGVITARSSGDTAIAVYNTSGDISLKGTTAITAQPRPLVKTSTRCM